MPLLATNVCKILFILNHTPVTPAAAATDNPGVDHSESVTLVWKCFFSKRHRKDYSVNGDQILRGYFGLPGTG